METSIDMIYTLTEGIKEDSLILEPSAGEGKLAKHLVLEKECSVDCIELNGRLVKRLQESGLYGIVTHADFLTMKGYNHEYDYVIAVPPYRDNIDCQHIMKMYHYLKDGGELRSFTLPYWITGFYENQRKFREWLSNKDYTMKLFENDESYLSCPKMLLTIRK